MLKSLLSALARSRGYRIVRDRDHVAQIDLFELLVDKLTNNRPDFFFIQIGANDGLMDDPIQAYVKRFHWRGILVEPVRFYFDKLRTNYAGESQLIFENAAIAQTDATLKLFTLPPSPDLPDWAHGCTSFNRENLLKHRSTIADVANRIEEVSVASMTFMSLLARHDVKHIDLLQIDVEGFDYEILKLINFAKIKPRLIQFEHFLLPLAAQRECYALLNGHGYELNTVGSNTIALLSAE